MFKKKIFFYYILKNQPEMKLTQKNHLSMKNFFKNQPGFEAKINGFIFMHLFT
jgi:hypothetical protein